MGMSENLREAGYLTGQMLIAMPQMQDPRFSRSVVYICAHTAEGAMGLVVNRLFNALSFPDLLEQLNIKPTPVCDQIRVHFGGPVESGRGFVLHTDDYCAPDSSIPITPGISLTATRDVLEALAGHNSRPRKAIMALGYAGWGAGQLEEEIKANVWLTCEADDALIFDRDHATKWNRALAKIGVDPRFLSSEAGGRA